MRPIDLHIEELEVHLATDLLNAVPSESQGNPGHPVADGLRPDPRSPAADGPARK